MPPNIHFTEFYFVLRCLRLSILGKYVIFLITLECCESKCLNNTPRVIEPGSKYQLGAALIPLPYKTGFDLTRTHDDRGITDFALFVVTEPKTVKYVF